jgi:hypothetical protein
VPGHPFETFEDLALRGITFEPRDPPSGVAVGVGYAYALWMYMAHMVVLYVFTPRVPGGRGGARGAAPGSGTGRERRGAIIK